MRPSKLERALRLHPPSVMLEARAEHEIAGAHGPRRPLRLERIGTVGIVQDLPLEPRLTGERRHVEIDPTCILKA